MLISARVTGAGSSRYQGVSADRSVELALLPTEVWVECRAVALGANAGQFLAGVWHVMTTFHQAVLRRLCSIVGPSLAFVAFAWENSSHRGCPALRASTQAVGIFLPHGVDDIWPAGMRLL